MNEEQPIQEKTVYRYLNEYSTSENGLEEIYYSEKVKSIEIDLNVDVLSLKAITNEGDLIELEGSDLDKTIDELAGNIFIEGNNNLNKDKLWKTQRILKGTSGDDILRLEGRSYSEDEIH